MDLRVNQGWRLLGLDVGDPLQPCLQDPLLVPHELLDVVVSRRVTDLQEPERHDVLVLVLLVQVVR